MARKIRQKKCYALYIILLLQHRLFKYMYWEDWQFCYKDQSEMQFWAQYVQIKAKDTLENKHENRNLKKFHIDIIFFSIFSDVQKTSTPN